MTRHLRRTACLLLMLPLTSATTASCGCTEVECSASAVYVQTGDLPADATVEICLATECASQPVGPGSGDPDAPGSTLTGAALMPGQEVEVRVTARNAAGGLLGVIHETRVVPDGTSRCTCASLVYRWVNGRLKRSA